jgi:hypothetical protein
LILILIITITKPLVCEDWRRHTVSVCGGAKVMVEGARVRAVVLDRICTRSVSTHLQVFRH